MPRLDGTELLNKLRQRSALPVIFLTSKDDELDEALGLGIGADDYITKPFSQRLLLARIKAVLRRAGLEGVIPSQVQLCHKVIWCWIPTSIYAPGEDLK